MTTYYISAADGNNTYNGLYPAYVGGTDGPWLTLGKANTTLQAGDTVYIRTGTYDGITVGPDYVGYAILPSNSGTAGNYITYQNYNGEEVWITATEFSACGAWLKNRSYIKIDGIKFGRFSKWVYCQLGEGETSSHNIIQNCYFDASQLIGSGWAGMWFGTSDGSANGICEYNQIVDNVFSEITCYPSDAIYFLGGGSTKYNLIQGNTFDGASHVVLELQESGGTVRYNIVKNNIIRNKFHTGINCYGGSSWNVIEGNTIYDCGTEHEINYCGSQHDRELDDPYHPSIIVEGSHNIIRKNILYNNGNFGVENYGDECDDNRIYHNTSYGNYMDWFTSCSDQVHNNQFKNNISSGAKLFGIKHDAQNANRLNYFKNNCIYDADTEVYWYPDGSKTVEWMEDNYSSLWQGNIISNPKFVNAETKNFHLADDSPCINTGTWLTTITSETGSGTEFDVSDVSYFCDGFGITVGDEMQLQGQSSPVTITDIDYNTNTITVDESIGWTQGDGVALAYSGTAPDMGAFEYTWTTIALRHYQIR